MSAKRARSPRKKKRRGVSAEPRSSPRAWLPRIIAPCESGIRPLRRPCSVGTVAIPAKTGRSGRLHAHHFADACRVRLLGGLLGGFADRGRAVALLGRSAAGYLKRQLSGAGDPDRGSQQGSDRQNVLFHGGHLLLLENVFRSQPHMRDSSLAGVIHAVTFFIAPFVAPSRMPR